MHILQYFILLLPFSASLFWALTLFCGRKGNEYPRKIWILYVLLIIFNALLAAVGERIIFVGNPITEAILLLIWAGFLYYSGYKMQQKKQTIPFSDAEQSCNEETDETDKKEITTKAHYKLLPHFNKLIDDEKIFLQNNLHIEKVARMLSTNRTYISRLINQEYQCSFSDYINLRRIEYAKILAHSHPELTQEQIAEKVGFTHASSFSRTFKQLSGQTFREWNRNNQENKTLSGKG